MFALDLFSWLLIASNLLVMGLVALLAVEIVAGCTWTLPPRARLPLPPRIAVVVPAHNEAGHIARVLGAIKADLRSQDTLLVVADNCDDDTYDVARSLGVAAIRRDEPERRGKGFALDFAVRHLSADPPDVVVVMDADCFATSGSLDQLASWAWASGRPVQAQYEMLLPGEDSSTAISVSAFSYRVKAIIRPLGLQRLGLPCGLMGTGMALRWDTISQARLATSHIVEDLLLSLELARDGNPPQYCYDAKIWSMFPTSAVGQKNQRERWETGHLNMILEVLPNMLRAALKGGNLPLFALIADTAIPPLALLALLLCALLALSSVTSLLGGSELALSLAAINALSFAAAVAFAWRTAFPGRSIGGLLVRIPGYVVGKLSIYLKVAMRRQIPWIRTHRE